MANDPVDIGPDVAESGRTLEALHFACISLMEISCASLVMVQSVSRKLRLSHDIWTLARAADLIGRRLPGLRLSDITAKPGSDRYVRFISEISSLPLHEDKADALAYVAYPDLLNGLRRHRARVHARADEGTITCLDDTIGLVSQLAARSTGGPLVSVRLEFDGVAGHVDGPAPDAEPQLALPVIPQRPGRERQLREELDVARNPSNDGLGAALHDVIFRIELCAAEICAAVIAHHREAPWGLKLDLAKQVRDEARHFELLAARMEELGTNIGDYPIRYEVWDKFTLGETLVERIMIEQRLGEGLGLDGGLAIYRWMKDHGDERTALLFDYINADEVTHVGNGNRWLRELLGGDSAVAELDERIRDRLAGSGWPIRHGAPINVDDRRLSGFTADELERLQQAWERGRRERASSDG